MSTSSTPSDGTPAAWSGRFSEPVSEIVKRYTASIHFDYRLAEFDIQGSLAHAAMLHHVGVLSKDDLTAAAVAYALQTSFREWQALTAMANRFFMTSPAWPCKRRGPNTSRATGMPAQNAIGAGNRESFLETP